MSHEWNELQIHTRELANLLKYGCTDGGCRMVRRQGGMHTNGGCGCIERLADLALEIAICAEANKRRYSGKGTVMP